MRNWFDGCDAEEWSLLFLPDILKELGYAEFSTSRMVVQTSIPYILIGPNKQGVLYIH